MLRPFQAFFLGLCITLTISGCKEEVKEIPPSDTTETPKYSEEDKKKMLDGENKQQTEGIKKRAENKKKGKSKAGS